MQILSSTQTIINFSLEEVNTWAESKCLPSGPRSSAVGEVHFRIIYIILLDYIIIDALMCLSFIASGKGGADFDDFNDLIYCCQINLLNLLKYLIYLLIIFGINNLNL